MNKCPKVGQRVRYTESDPFPGTIARTVTGTVMKIYQQHDYPGWDPDDLDDEPHHHPRVLRAEKDWKVTIKVDVIPTWWPYLGNDKFCPEVAEVEVE